MNTASPGKTPVNIDKVADRTCKPERESKGGSGNEGAYCPIVKLVFRLDTRMLVNKPWLNTSPGGGHSKIAIALEKYRKVIMNNAAGTILSKDMKSVSVSFSDLDLRR